MRLQLLTWFCGGTEMSGWPLIDLRSTTWADKDANAVILEFKQTFWKISLVPTFIAVKGRFFASVVLIKAFV